MPPPTVDAFAVPGGSTTGLGIDLGLAAAALGGLGMILWAVPSLALGVSGLLVVLAVAAQTAGGLAWLPVVRRKIGSYPPERRLRRPLP
jgi:hypothetical protein